MHVSHPALAIVWLVGCGGLDPVIPVDREVLPTQTGATATEPDHTGPDTWQTPSTWSSSGETWRIDVRPTRDDNLQDAAWAKLDRELLIEVLYDDAPKIAVRTSALIADTLVQDFCVAAVEVNGTVTEDGWFRLRLGPEDLDLGQPWTWDAVEISGIRRPNLGTVDELEVTASIPQPCSAAPYSACGPCVNLVGECLTVGLDVEIELLTDFILEPVSPADVALNPACDPD